MVANGRAEYQRLCEELRTSADGKEQEKLRSSIRALITADDSYARGFIEDSLKRSLRYISPTVGRDEGRPFSLAVEIHYPGGQPVVLLGAAFLPRLDDDTEELVSYFGEEIYGLARLKGFDWLIAELAVNGKSIPRS
jgi:hypothetical protein